MNNILKACCLAIYLLAMVAMLGVIPTGIAKSVQVVAAVLIGLHVLEVLLALKFIKRHEGLLIDSIALTLLFGFLHWLPLARR